MKNKEEIKTYSLRRLVLACSSGSPGMAIWDLLDFEYIQKVLVKSEMATEDIDKLRNYGLKNLLHSNQPFIQDSIVCIDRIISNYYHFVLEDLVEILYLDKEARKIDFKYKNIIITDRGSFQKQYIELCGLEAKVTPIRYREGNSAYALVIMNALIANKHHRDRSKQLINSSNINLIKSNINLIKSYMSPRLNYIRAERFTLSSKIYIERKTSSNYSQLRGIYPVEESEKIFNSFDPKYIQQGKLFNLPSQSKFHEDLVKNGYEIIFLDELTVEDQIRLFSSAKVVAAVHGAALTNIIYMQKEAKLIEFHHEKYQPNIFENLAKACGINNYENISAKGLLNENQENIMMMKLVQRDDIYQVLPLSYDNIIKEALFGK